jgi:hypothetical protein
MAALPRSAAKVSPQKRSTGTRTWAALAESTLPFNTQAATHFQRRICVMKGKLGLGLLNPLVACQ